jgi:hypothetical protein
VKGLPIPDGQAASVLGRYFDMQSLAELGWQAPIDRLDSFHEGCFLVISDELARIRSKAAKKNA